MQLNQFERDLFRDLAFFSGQHVLFGQTLRPLSLASYKAMQMMGLTLLEEEHQLDEAQETAEIAAFLWLHTAPVQEVCDALWAGTWRAMLEMEASKEVIKAFRLWRSRLVAMIEAASIQPRPRPKQGKDDTPSEVVGPAKFAFTVSQIAHFTGFPRQEILWEIFLPEALQYYHAALRWQGVWTAVKGRTVKEADLEDLMPDFLKEELGIDSRAEHGPQS